VDLAEERLVIGTRPGRSPLLAGTAWGRLTVGPRTARVDVLGGALRLAVVTTRWAGRDSTVRVCVDGSEVAVDLAPTELGVDLRPRVPLELAPGSVLELFG
jgi:hypothetical protein